MTRLETTVLGLVMLGMASPAFAGGAPVPASIAGVGIGAVILAGVGYRALKRRINP